MKMILNTMNEYPIVEYSNNDLNIDQNDLNVTLTFSEHELMNDVLMQAVEAIGIACPYGLHDLPIDSEIVQRYTMIENLRERFNTAWSDRFNTGN